MPGNNPFWCHAGRTVAITLLVAAIVHPLNRTAHAQSGDSQAAELLKRAIAAAGGQRALEKLKRPTMWMETGTFYGMGDGTPFVAQYAARWPDEFRQEIEGRFVITISGDKGWVSSAAGVRLLTEAELPEQLKLVQAEWAARLFPLTDNAWKLTTIEGVEVNDRATVGFVARHEDSRDIRFYFDKETYLLTKIDTTVVSPQHGPNPVQSETVFTAHKPVSGARLPSKKTTRYEGKLFVESETVAYKNAATLNPEHFVAPE